ncbi:MAG: helix-turn-helix domain-containing protein [Luteimonas sp.]
MAKMTEAQLVARDRKRNIGEELLQAVREIKTGGGRRFTLKVSQTTEARLKLKLSQTEFAEILGVSVRTLQDWEQGRRQPSGAAKALLQGRDRITKRRAQGVEGGMTTVGWVGSINPADLTLQMRGCKANPAYAIH